MKEDFSERLITGVSETVASISASVGNVLRKVFPSQNQRTLDSLKPVVQSVNQLEAEVSNLKPEEFGQRTQQFRERLKAGESLDEILPAAFALVREAARRTLGLRHFDVQLIGGVVLHQGKIAEMSTGEGKTLVATAPAYLNALLEKGVYVVTVNDYLARRDAEWMGPVYRYLGLKVGAIQSDMSAFERQKHYACDITYGTNNEFGFDYLRDNMKNSAAEQVQKNLYYAIVDEVDSILIDEARTPLIISGLPEASTRKYYLADGIARKLAKGVDFEIKEKEHQAILTDEGIEKSQRFAGVDSFYAGGNMDWPHHLEQALRAHHLYQRDHHYVVKPGEDGTPEVVIVDEFTGRLMAGRRWSDGLHQAVEAKEGIRIKEEHQTLATITFQNYFRLYDKIAGMTGTAMTEAAEFAKIYNLDVVAIPTNRPNVRKDFEDVVYRSEKEKIPSIVEEIVRVHEKGQPVLVGTISIAKSELVARYLSDPTLMAQVVSRRCTLATKGLDKSRKKLDPGIVKEVEDLLGRPARTDAGSAQALADRVEELDPKGDLTFWLQAVARGIKCVRMIEGGLKFHVLNAKQHAREAEIVAQAGRKGAITISTNMAGRGTDILLGGNAEFLARQEVGREADEATFKAALARYKTQCEQEKQDVLAAGGLHILGTERHEARRIDNQLRGRSGRQGDPGSSRFFLSLEDDLMRIFASERTQRLLELAGMTEGIDIQSPMVSRSIQRAQKKVESRNFEIRKNLLEYDEVMDKQRKTIYDLRQRILEGADLKQVVLDMVEDQLTRHADTYLGESKKEWEVEPFVEGLNRRFGSSFAASEIQGLERDDILARVTTRVRELYGQREAQITPDEMRRVERYVLLHVLDSKWKDHLYFMDALKSGIGLRSYAQIDPKNEYKKEGLVAFEALLASISDEVTSFIFKLRLVVEPPPESMPDSAAPRTEPAAAPRSVPSSTMRGSQQAFTGSAVAKAAAANAAVSNMEAQRRGREQAMQSAGRSTQVKTIKRDEPKVGRNDPCPCGSGKKYKKCHGPGAGE